MTDLASPAPAHRILVSDFDTRVTLYFNTTQERDATLAEFPKSVGAKPSFLSRPAGENWSGGSEDVPTITFYAKSAADGVNGGINETGAKRLRSFLRTVERLGLTLEHDRDD